MINQRTRLWAAAYFALPLLWLLLISGARAQPVAGTQRGDLTKARAHWLTRDTIAWRAANMADGARGSYKLYFAPEGGLTLTPHGIDGGESITLSYDPAGLSPALRAKFPHLAGFAALKLSAADMARVPSILKGQSAIAASDASGQLLDATSLQLPGVLDDLYTYTGALGVVWRGDHEPVPLLKLWAPTARSVRLHLFPTAASATAATVVPMKYEATTGVWSVTGNAGWLQQFYLYEVSVFVPTTGRIEQNLVTDPYSLSLATNSRRSQIVNLDAPALKPAGWDALRKPPLDAPEDIALYELHLRDFSSNDQTVPAAHRGTYLAFTDQTANGMKHLRALAEAGLTHVHLLPVFDIATINEVKAERKEPDPAELSKLPPDSERQQEIISARRDEDGFNWGYEPFHYIVPEGSYATSADGPTRIREFRAMVKGLSEAGLRVVMDVVYNHTTADGQDPRSVLDKIVPGYYYRLNLDGQTETSTCCRNTASEHAMMEKLLVDSVVTWARAYKVDGFRFDLMGHHMVGNMLKVRAALRALTLQHDGVDGAKIYLYGEGWNFGEVANGARGPNATQVNLAGTGIGTFNDRLRDGVRGGQFGPLQEQGFVNGLYLAPNGTEQGTLEAQKEKLLRYTDWIRAGLAGSLRAYRFEDHRGQTVAAAQVDYGGQPAGYTADPQEAINYTEAHDDYTLYDFNVLRAPRTTTVEARVRMQNLALDLVALAQGLPFFHAGQDMLRSKSLDHNSYNSGDWFNRLDFTYATNNFGVGLPPKADNGERWPLLRPLLADPKLRPTRADIMQTVAHLRELLRIRKSSRLFRLTSAADINARLRFYNTGPQQTPGLVVMAISDTVGRDLDPDYDLIVVLCNATPAAQAFSAPAFVHKFLTLHPVQVRSSDRIVRTSSFNTNTGTFTIPARTTAVFVARSIPGARRR
ncbi:MAG TPA: pullulanase-type alpha-1,6-glucosidase [Pyrinomonadaceae bacterium]|jgi:pullulanase-type alpha-1,6-glucosidase